MVKKQADEGASPPAAVSAAVEKEPAEEAFDFSPARLEKLQGQ